jgi:putative ABC transport system permease protein
MDTLIQDLRYGVRTLLKNRSFTSVAVLALALGIGANTAIFSVVNAVLLRPLPYQEPERIVRVEEQHESWGRAAGLTYASFLDFRDDSKSLENIAAYRPWNFNLTDEGEPEQAGGALVTASFFHALGVKPVLGRFFLPEEDQPGNNKVVILGQGLWQRRFGSDPNIIGRAIKINDESHSVIGVMPPGFQFPDRSDLWTPLAPTGGLRANRRAHLLTVIARLKPGTSTEQSQAELDSISQQIQEQNPGVDPELALNVIGLQQKLVAPVRPALLVLFGAVGLVLLIACTNVASLLLARATTREKEIAIRSALGATHLRLIRQLLTESLLLALLGGLLGSVIARWSVDLMIAFSPGDIPRLDEVSIDGRVLAFTLLASLLTGVIFGIAPALESTKVDLNRSLKEGGRSSSSPNNHLRNLLVVSEVAFGLVLLIGAGLLINSFKRLVDVNPGFNPKNVLTMQLFLSGSKYGEDHQQSDFLKQVLERIKTVPGVASAGLVNTLPITGGVSTDFEIVGRPPASVEEEPDADICIIDPDYFRAMEIPLLSGRSFSERDSSDSQRVMVINQTMARRYWPDEDPIGKRVTMKDWGEPLTGEIVGVVGDIKSGGLHSENASMIYWPYPQFPSSFNRVVIRTSIDPMNIVAAVKEQVWSVDKEQPMSDIKTMDQVLSASLAQRRFNMALLGGFAVVALILAAVGIYGVISYSVTQRTREIGIRMALGAERRDILRLVMARGLFLTLLGLAFGLAGAFFLTRAMESLLFGVSVHDPITFAVISLLLSGVALGACFVPARRATRVDPMVALRYE